MCGVLFGALAARFDDSWALPAYLVLAAALVALSVIDLELYILPNRIVYPLTLAMVVLLTLAAVGDDDLDAIGRGLLAGVVAFTIFFVLHMISPRSMGFGDVKLVVRPRPVARLARLGRGAARPVPRLLLRRGDRHRAHRHARARRRARRSRSGRSSPPARSPPSSSATRSSTGTAGADAAPGFIVANVRAEATSGTMNREPSDPRR